MTRTLASQSVAGPPLDRTPGKGPGSYAVIRHLRSLYVDLPCNQRPLHSPRHPLLIPREGPAMGTSPCNASPFGRPEVPPEPAYTGVYLLLAVPRSRFMYLSLHLLSRSPHHVRPFPGPVQDCSVLLNRGTWGDKGGGLGGGWEPKTQREHNS